MTVLVVGGSGFLGSELLRQGREAGWGVAGTFQSRPGDAAGVAWHRLDVRDPGRVEAVLGAVSPQAVIDVTSGGADWRVTADGSVHVAMAAAKLGVRLVHVSSDAVFSGSRVRYDETCDPDPITPYGAAKAAAETAVRLLCPGAAVVRTSLIVGNGRSGHERVAHALVAGAREGVLFSDDVRCPVHVEDLAAGLWELARSEAAGVFHLAGSDALSRYDLGVLIARRDGLDVSRLPAGRRVDVGVPGPLDVRLDSRVSQRWLSTRLRGAREFLGGSGL
ncbi:SDR family oxidoreductase [Streptomyces bauhiniae]